MCTPFGPAATARSGVPGQAPGRHPDHPSVTSHALLCKVSVVSGVLILAPIWPVSSWWAGSQVDAELWDQLKWWLRRQWL